MAVNWGISNIPLSNTAPTTNLAQDFTQGAQAATSPGLAQANLSMAQTQAANAPSMAQLQQEVLKSGIKSSDLDNATKTFTMAQNMLAPSMVAMRSGDMNAAANIYNNNVQALKSQGIDTKAQGIPDTFDPNYVQYAMNNVSQQLAMAKQMQDILVSQSTVGKNQADVLKAGSDINASNYATGNNNPLPGGGMPSQNGPGSFTQQINNSGVLGIPNQYPSNTPQPSMQGVLGGLSPAAINAGGAARPPIMPGPVPFNVMQQQNGQVPAQSQGAIQQIPALGPQSMAYPMDLSSNNIPSSSTAPPPVDAKGQPVSTTAEFYTGLSPTIANANLPQKMKDDAYMAQLKDWKASTDLATGAAADATSNLPLIAEGKEIVKNLSNLGPLNTASAKLRPDVQRLDAINNRIFTQNLAQFTATTHVNRLDIPIANGLHNITPKSDDAVSTQIKSYDAQENINKGIQVSGYIASKLSQMGVSDQSVLNNVKNAVADKIYTKGKVASSPGVWNNGTSVADKVINDMVKGKQSLAPSSVSKPSSGTSMYTLPQLIASGQFSNATAAQHYFDNQNGNS